VNLRLLPGTNELDLSGGRLNFVSGADEVGQLLRTRLLLMLGEWFLDPSAGLPLFQRILGKLRSLSLVKSEIRKVILATAGVTGIISLDVTLDPATRKVSATFKASSPTGVVSGTVP
jgi:hypothetical protein